MVGARHDDGCWVDFSLVNFFWICGAGRVSRTVDSKSFSQPQGLGEKFSKCPVPAVPAVPSGLHPFNVLEPFPAAFAVCNPDPFFPQNWLQHLQPFRKACW